MSDFQSFAKLVHARYEEMIAHELYVVNTDPDGIWSHYLGAFPEGSNPVFRERTEHDCSCCKHYVRNIGNVVAIVEGERVCVWDVDAEHPYDAVAKHMSQLVKQLPIVGVFRTPENRYGAAHTHELRPDGTTHRWHHFHADVTNRHQSSDAAAERGRIASVAGVFRRGLDGTTIDALDTVTQLIESNNLYRGEEHAQSVREFYGLKRWYDATPDKELFVWANVGNPAARFRNTVIGSLITDLSDGVDVEHAVRAFESKVAPSNYKRPKSIITPNMVKDAMETIRGLGLEDALQRRHARLSDVSVNDVLFVDNTMRVHMKDGVEGLLMDAATRRIEDKVTPATPITIDQFMSDVLPRVQNIDLMLEGSHLHRFASLTAPVHADVAPLFKWGNNFAWSYDGNVADSVKQRVKAAGGNVDARLRVSLSWFNGDDLDIHCVEPYGRRISFRNKCGVLDVDMNAGGPGSREPVENLSWKTVKDGMYAIAVHQYRRRENTDTGFELEVEFEGDISTFTYAKPMQNNEKVECLRLFVERGELMRVDARHMSRGRSSVDKWGLTTERFVPVDTIVHSPNHWDGNAAGNKHWFFILSGCANPEPVRGIYNEFLRADVEKHRKVFEVLGDKTKCPVVQDQLSGVGFSSTQHTEVVLRTHDGKNQRAYRVSI